MQRSLWLIFAALALIAAGVLLQYQPQKLALAAPADPEPPSVRIQHEFVQLSAAGAVTETPSTRSAGRTPRTPSTGQSLFRMAALDEAAPAALRQPVQHRDRQRTLFEKARRAFVGDGRHRPEPFPRVREDH